MHYVMNMCPRVCETLLLVSIVRDCGISLSKSHHIFYLMQVFSFLENLNSVVLVICYATCIFLFIIIVDG